jgi:A118 family predicted phage portal protein
MPLPEGRNLDWPPRELATITPAMETWSAWYGGDTAILESVYLRERRTSRPSDRPSTYRGGVVGAVARTFWGAPRTDLTQSKSKLHVPIAADLCQASADLLFSEPPTITADNDATTERLDELVDDGMLGTLAEAAELAAALGGTYLRVTWDKDLQPDGPFTTAVDADGAWPEFRWGRLTAVTFWYVVRTTDTEVWRHLERHELDGENGVVLHGLYQGTRDHLGRSVPLNESTATAGLATQVAEGNRIDTLSPGLAVTYVPNQRPQRRWRHDPLGRNLGRSDLDGVEGLMDSLDETYTSWMRDIRLGKARILAASALLDSGGPGQGASFDGDREVYESVKSMAGTGKDSAGLPIEQIQFKIRYAEHQATAQELTQRIVQTAGYSAQTFGDAAGDNAPQATATEIRARERRSYMTRDRKLRHWRPALAEHLAKLLAVDSAVFGKGGDPAGLDIAFGDAVQESPLALAQTAQALRTAEAASTKTLVAMQHPDWSDEDVDSEVSAILAERQTAVPDPFTDPTADPLNDPADDAAGSVQQ